MELLEFVREIEAPIVVVDDLLARPSLAPVPASVRSAWISELKSDPAAMGLLSAQLGMSPESTPRELGEASIARIDELWDLYDSDAEEFVYLATLFEHVADHRSQAERPRKLIDAIEAAVGRKPLTFSSLQDAADSLRDCAVAFVDLYLAPGLNNFQAIIEVHGKYREQYRSMFSSSGDAWPKLIVLMSSNLPGEQDLRCFREHTGVRSAFFRGLNKRDMADGTVTVESLLAEWSPRYEQSSKMNRYLESISDSVVMSSNAVMAGIERLEIHDLAVLDAARLIAEGANLHSYMGWLVSELLATKAREEFAERVTTAPLRASSGAIDPRLVNDSVLFDMFADIAVSPPNATGAPEFGEVFAPANQDWTQPFDVFVALSPACDLARCQVDFEVLLLQGSLDPSVRSTDVLLEQSAHYGKGFNLVTFTMDGQKQLGRITWKKERALTRPAGHLADPEQYIRLTRLSELFAHEIKDFALSNLSRIGLPVAPSVQKVGTVEVRMKFALGQGIPPFEEIRTAPAGPDVSALMALGRIEPGGKEENLIMLTEAFRTWFFSTFEPLLAPHMGVAKVRQLLEDLRQWEQWTVSMKAGKLTTIPNLAVKRGRIAGTTSTAVLEIWVDHRI